MVWSHAFRLVNRLFYGFLTFLFINALISFACLFTWQLKGSPLVLSQDFSLNLTDTFTQLVIIWSFESGLVFVRLKLIGYTKHAVTQTVLYPLLFLLQLLSKAQFPRDFTSIDVFLLQVADEQRCTILRNISFCNYAEIKISLIIKRELCTENLFFSCFPVMLIVSQPLRFVLWPLGAFRPPG